MKLENGIRSLDATHTRGEEGEQYPCEDRKQTKLKEKQNINIINNADLNLFQEHKRCTGA